MAVYLDTNVLVQRAGLGSLELTTTIALCREASLEMVLPALVADEIESSRLRVTEASFDLLRSSYREASRLAPLAVLPEFPNPGELAREYRRSLSGLFSIVSTPPHAPEEGLRRETFRLRPARAGAGARDTAIWLTVRDHHLERDEPGYFVTANVRDFAATEDTKALHPALLSEVAAHSSPLVLSPSLADLVRVLGDPAPPFVDEQALRELATFKRAAGRLLHESSFFQAMAPPVELDAKPDGHLFAGSEVAVSLCDVYQLHGYVVETRNVCVARLGWQMAFELGTLEKAGVGRMQRTLPVRCDVVGLVWLVEDSAGGDPAVEIGHVATTHVAAR